MIIKTFLASCSRNFELTNIKVKDIEDGKNFNKGLIYVLGKRRRYRWVKLGIKLCNEIWDELITN